MYRSGRSDFCVREFLPRPNPNCQSCQTNYFSLQCDTRKTSIKQMLNVIRKEFSLETGDLSVEESKRLIYDLDFDDNASKSLDALVIGDGKKMSVTFDSDIDPERTFVLHFFVKHTRFFYLNASFLLLKRENFGKIIIIGNKNLIKHQKTMVSIPENFVGSVSKRKAEDDVVSLGESKRTKTVVISSGDEDDIICI